MQLKDYQDIAIADLQTKLYRLWRNGCAPASLVFKAPTGAGKTVMAAELLSRIGGDAQFNPDKAFIWFSFNPDSVEQSRAALHKYLNGGVAGLYDTDQISSRGRLKKNDVLFVNWQKLNTRSRERLRLRKDGEATISFDTFIANTKADGREIIAIIDECHLVKTGDLAGEIMRLVAPRVELLVSATPLQSQIPTIEQQQQGIADMVIVDQADVVASGVIKRTIRIMPREDIEELRETGRDLDATILDLAVAKRFELAESYKRAGSRVNPLVLIKLPNDDAKSRAAGDDKLTFVRHYLAEIGVPDHKIATWLSAKKENLSAITDIESPIDFLIFKQAAATGWDCPRADVLVMFREIENPIFETQILGRILRTAEGRHYPQNPALDDAYLYTSYERDVIESPTKQHSPNTQNTCHAFRRAQIANVHLPSIYVTRAEYNDLGDSFQDTFATIADRHFGITPKDALPTMLKKLDAAKLDRGATTVTNRLIVDANVEVFDDFVAQIAQSTDDLDLDASRLDVQKLYTNLLWKELKIQDEPASTYAPARSWSPLKSALNIYFRDKLKIPNPPLYSVICNDLVKGERSALRPIITKALRAYRPVRDAENIKKALSLRKSNMFSINDFYALPEDTPIFVPHRKKAATKYALKPAFISFDSGLEIEFANYLESSNVDWWFKNGDNGSDFLGIPYTDEAGVERTFYPDFIVRCGKRLAILDTKSGLVAKDAAPKADALVHYIANTDCDVDLWGGIVTHHSGLWKIHDQPNYSFEPDKWPTLEL